MKANHINYDHEKSSTRIKAILDEPAGNFEELSSIPNRSELTFTNGFYVYCTALFIDIRGSSTLSTKHTRPVLAKIYRSYISEAVAVMNGSSLCSEVNIHGDCVNGIFDTPEKSHIDEVFEVSGRLSSMIDILNSRLRKKGYEEIKVGIGMDYGRALMIKAGYSGSGINDVIWMGDVVNSASNLCHIGSKNGLKRNIYSGIIRQNLKEKYREYLYKTSTDGIYHANIHDVGMNNWMKDNL